MIQRPLFAPQTEWLPPDSFPDLTHSTQLSYDRNKDDENRLFYVGATRTKEHLHIVRPKDENKAFPMGDV